MLLISRYSKTKAWIPAFIWRSPALGAALIGSVAAAAIFTARSSPMLHAQEMPRGSIGHAECLIEQNLFRRMVITCPQFGAVPDARTVPDGAISAGKNTLASVRGFAGIRAGMLVEVEGAGSGGALLVTKVARVTDDKMVQLAAAASTTVSNAHVGYGSDNKEALYDAMAAASPGGTVLIPDGHYYVVAVAGDELSGLKGVTVEGTGQGAVLKWLHPTTGANGFVIRHTLSKNVVFTNFAIDLNNGRRAGKSSFGIICLDGCNGVSIHHMRFFDSRATAAVVGADLDRYAVVFGAPATAHENIDVHDNLVEDELQIECHLKCRNLQVHHNAMINAADAPRTTAAVWIGTEVNTGGSIEDVDVSHNIIKGYKGRAVNLILNGGDHSGSIRRVAIRDNIIVSAATQGNTGIFVGVGASNLTYNEPIAFDDIEVSGNQIFVSPTVTNDFAGIIFNNGADTGFRFQRAVLARNKLSRTAYLNDSANDGISVAYADGATIAENDVTGFRFGYRLSAQENLTCRNNRHRGLFDDKESAGSFSGLILSGHGDGNDRCVDSRFEGQYEDAVVWLLGPGMTDIQFVRTRINAVATAGFKVDDIAAQGLQLVDSYINGVTTAITRNGKASAGRAQIRGTQFGPVLPATFFVPGITDASDTWLLAERVQTAEVVDTGDSKPGALTLVPYYKFVQVKCSDPDGNDLTIGKAQAAQGMELVISVVGPQSCGIRHDPGAFRTLSRSNTMLSAGERMQARYDNGAWHQTQ